jgi:regulator of protease activity HflC (stomatin/prohibitin superfamily)
MTKDEAVGTSIITTFGLLVLGGLTFLFMWGCPRYNVYRQTLNGEALLREAESSRLISVEEAKAKLESSKSLAQAEVERAKGVAEANKIIGEGLRGHEEYLRYLWIMSLEHTAQGDGTVIYVPTETNLPILEAGRLQKAEK